MDLRFGQHGEMTRFVVEMTRKPAYQIFTLNNPYRVVIDMPEMEWGAANGKATGVVKGFRHGLFRPGVTRIVVDASKPVNIEKHFVLGSSDNKTYRLVVDLKPISASQFASSTRKVESADWKNVAQEETKTVVIPAPDGQQSADATRPAKPMIVLDAGHGGPDPGAIGGAGTREKNVTLAVAKAVQKQLLATGRYRVKLTRDRDFYIPLRKRYRVAEDNNAELFVSLHADKIERSSVRGASVYTLSERSSDKEAAKLAAKENKSDIIVGVDLSGYDEVVARTLLDFEQRATMEMSWHFAEMLVGEMGKEIKLLRNTHRFAGFAVLKSPTVPSVLIELGYLSNRQDEKLLKSPAQHKKIAKSLQKAIDNYFERQERLSKS
ncbi:N-acetylmuramoyl-L-alanine amidase [Curvivirga aplysinae]|uniref:N-acetylmuramoyl-L-alanine amidase n=1 Tax=Curvivirga aplysinae TaxID=2529852 RepID=UPI001C3F8CC4|nr:N-acetylmuramoyl-L-alanine amidase [Curvivirga aplysinae]